MVGLDFFVTATCFSVLGYGLCYITLSASDKIKDPKIDSENPIER